MNIDELRELGCAHGPGVIRTFTGRTFDLANPTPGQVEIEHIAHSLALQTRFVGACRCHYSVAQHSVMVSRLCPPELALAGLLHDAHEAYTGDWSRPLKLLMPTEFRLWLKRLQVGIDMAVGQRFGLCDGWHNKIPVTEADNLALAREGRDLMSGWQGRGLPEPVGEPVVPWVLPDTAELEFLNRFKELGANDHTLQNPGRR